MYVSTGEQYARFSIGKTDDGGDVIVIKKDHTIECDTVKEALQLSIAKWEKLTRMLELREDPANFQHRRVISDGGHKTCALCVQSGKSWLVGKCGNCVIAAQTGEGDCCSTPYTEYMRAVRERRFDDSVRHAGEMRKHLQELYNRLYPRVVEGPPLERSYAEQEFDKVEAELASVRDENLALTTRVRSLEDELRRRKMMVEYHLKAVLKRLVD